MQKVNLRKAQMSFPEGKFAQSAAVGTSAPKRCRVISRREIWRYGANQRLILALWRQSTINFGAMAPIND
jgi:hypothetical protein